MTEKELHIAKCWLNDAMEYGEEEHNKPFELAIEALDKVHKYETLGSIEELKTKINDKEFSYKTGYNHAISNLEKEIRNWQIDIQDNEYDSDKYNFVFDRIYEIIQENSFLLQETPKIHIEDINCDEIEL